MLSPAKQCPSCRSVYSGNDKVFCPLDGTRLIDQAAKASGAKPPDDPLIGRTIAGRFVLEKRLGTGGMGVVYLASHAVLGRPFAVKLLLREFVANERTLARFFREARVASSVDHPNIVSIYDYGQTDQGEPYLVMEYVEGISLLQVVRQSRTRNLLPSYAVHLLLQVARGLEHAHQRGVVHRDIKPENLLVTTWQGQTDFIKILDFGVARVVGQPALTRVGEEILGTPEFMAPELLTEAEVAPPVDLYALGIMLHDTIVGEAPFRGDIRSIMQGHLSRTPPRLSERRRDVAIPPELDDLCAQLLEKEPTRRPTAAQTVQRLEALQGQLPRRGDRGSTTSAGAQPTAGEADGARTLILNHAALGPVEAASPAAGEGGTSTMILPVSAVRVSDLVKVADPAKRAEIDALEGEMEVASERLAREVQRLAEDLWGAATSPTQHWPADARALQDQIDVGTRSAEGHSVRLSTLLDQSQKAQQQQDARRRVLHQEILTLSERLQLERSLEAAERTRILGDIESRERALASVLQGAPRAGSLDAMGLRRTLRDLQLQARRHYLDLARRVLRDATAQHAATSREIQSLMTQLETAQSMLQILTRSLSPSR